MFFFFAIAIISFFLEFCFNYSLSITSSKLNTRLRILMFDSMLGQEISFHDLIENSSSILATKLSITASYCRGCTDKIAFLLKGFSW
jgi:hypothetical protein